MKTEIVKITELKEGDLFSFRTITSPIYWRFLSFIQGVITYEEIRSKIKHTSNVSLTVVRKQIK